MILKLTCTSARLFSGERFSVTYRIAGDEKSGRAKAEDICIEQAVEFPADKDMGNPAEISSCCMTTHIQYHSA